MARRSQGRAGGGREARMNERKGGQKSTYQPYIKRNIPYFAPMDEESLALIERNADYILATNGIDIRSDPESLELFKNAGAKIDGERVRFEPGMLKEIIQNSAPAQFTQHARNSAKNVVIGGANTVLVPGYGSPFVISKDEGRRYATIEDFRNFVKLAYMLNSLHHSGGTVCEPVDLPVNKRHLDMVFSHIRYSDKPFMGSVTAQERALDTIEMCKILFGEAFVDEHCVVTNLINVNSPLVYDDIMLGSLKVYARNNQACVVSPFILAGAMSPVSIIGTLTQIYAEATVGIALTQLVRKGAPVIFGTFASSISMQSGAPTFGTPEPSLVLYGAAQMARRLGVPFRSGGGLSASKVPDAQAAYESANTMQTAALAGVNFMLHTAGWVEGGLSMSYEKFVMDADQAAMIARLLEGYSLDDNAQALSAFAEVAPGEHFLGCAHTRENFEQAFYRSPLADNNSFEQWKADGEKDITVRANAQFKEMLATYEAPEIDAGIESGLIDFMNRRKSEMPDASF